MTESSSAKSYSILVVILLLSCVIVLYMAAINYWPAYTLAKDRLTLAQAENQQSKGAIASSATFLSNYQEQTANAALLNLALPKGDSDMSNFVSSLSGLATQSGMVLSNFSINTSATEVRADDNAIKVVELNVATSGTFLAFKDFVSRLEEHLRLIDVYHVTLTAGGATGAGSPPLSYSLKIRTYYQQ